MSMRRGIAFMRRGSIVAAKDISLGISAYGMTEEDALRRLEIVRDFYHETARDLGCTVKELFAPAVADDFDPRERRAILQ